MATREDAIDLCNSNDSDEDDSDADDDMEDANMEEDEGESNTSWSTRSRHVVIRQPSKVYLVIHDKEQTLTTTATKCTNLATVTERQQHHTVIVSVHFLLTDAIASAEDYVRDEFGIGGDNDDDESMESELDGVDWCEDGWFRSDRTNHLDHRVCVLEKPVS